MLGSRILDIAVMDLYAGSGALGIEALSRGAATATFVERDQRCVSILRQNLDALGYAGRATVVRADAAAWVELNPTAVSRAGAVFIDPPYRDAVLPRLLELLATSVAGGADVVVEHGRTDSPALPAGLQVVRERRYGATAVTVLRKP